MGTNPETVFINCMLFPCSLLQQQIKDPHYNNTVHTNWRRKRRENEKGQEASHLMFFTITQVLKEQMVSNIQQAAICDACLITWGQEMTKKKSPLNSLDVHGLFFSELSNEQCK